MLEWACVSIVFPRYPFSMVLSAFWVIVLTMCMRAGDLRSIYTSSLYNWNLLQYLGQDHISYVAEYRRVVEASILEGDPVAISRSQTRSKSRRFDSRAFHCSRSSVIRPTTTTRTVDVPRSTPAASLPQASQPREASEALGDSESVLKRPREASEASGDSESMLKRLLHILLVLGHMLVLKFY